MCDSEWSFPFQSICLSTFQSWARFDQLILNPLTNILSICMYYKYHAMLHFDIFQPQHLLVGYYEYNARLWVEYTLIWASIHGCEFMVYLTTISMYYVLYKMGNYDKSWSKSQKKIRKWKSSRNWLCARSIVKLRALHCWIARTTGIFPMWNIPVYWSAIRYLF